MTALKRIWFDPDEEEELAEQLEPEDEELEDYDPDQPRNERGEWTTAEGSSAESEFGEHDWSQMTAWFIPQAAATSAAFIAHQAAVDALLAHPGVAHAIPNAIAHFVAHHAEGVAHHAVLGEVSAHVIEIIGGAATAMGVAHLGIPAAFAWGAGYLGHEVVKYAIGHLAKKHGFTPERAHEILKSATHAVLDHYHEITKLPELSERPVDWRGQADAEDTVLAGLQDFADALDDFDPREISDFDPDEPRDPAGKWTSGGYGLAPGDVEKFHRLKDQWAKVNNELLTYVDRPDSPEAQKKIDELEALVHQMHGLHADPGGPEGIGLPGGPRDVTVVGAGPGGLAASIFGGAEGLDTLVVESNAAPGGQAKYSSRIENFPGFPVGVTGEKLTSDMFAQATRLGAETKLGQRVTGIDYDPATGIKHLTLSNGEHVDSRTVILAGGVEFRHPVFAGSEGSGVIVGDGKALTEACKDGEAVVVGGSNGAAQAALGAASKAKHVTLISRSLITKGMSDYQVEALRNHPKVTVIEGDTVTKMNRDAHGDPISVETDHGRVVPAKALGVFLGSVPETGWLEGKVKRDPAGRVQTDAKLETSIPGVFAVGDMRKGAIGRVGVAVGEGQLALREAHVYLEGLRHHAPATHDAESDDDVSDLIHRAFALDKANPYLGQTIEGVRPGRRA
jgi:thioredoxin reductase